MWIKILNQFRELYLFKIHQNGLDLIVPFFATDWLIGFQESPSQWTIFKS